MKIFYVVYTRSKRSGIITILLHSDGNDVDSSNLLFYNYPVQLIDTCFLRISPDTISLILVAGYVKSIVTYLCMKLVSVSYSGQIVLNSLDVKRPRIFVENRTMSLFAIHDARIVLSVIRWPWQRMRTRSVELSIWAVC